MTDNETTYDARHALLDHNIFITWKPEYNLGIPILDEQHRGIVSTINSLYYAIQYNFGRPMLQPIINTVREYTHIHFKIEEDLLKENGFPGLEHHQGLHRELTDTLFLASDTCLKDHDPEQFLDFLKLWWIEHICVKDRSFLAYSTKNMDKA